MPFNLTGDFGSTVFSSSTDDAGQITSRYVSVNTEANLNFFRKIAILKSNILSNSLGLFSFLNAGRNNKVRFASLTVPRHLLSKRKSGCVWNPKGKVSMNSSEVDLDAVEYNGEQCPDVFLGDCLEKIMGTGNAIRDVFATPEGRAIFGEMINNIYLGLGNSFYDLVWYGQHPLIQDAHDNEWYNVDEDEWDDYRDQQEATGGVMTMVDWFKNDGLDNFNVEIASSDISADGLSYEGRATDLFDKVLNAQDPVMKMTSKRANNQGRYAKTVLLVTSAIFAKYEVELQDTWDQIPKMFEYYYNGRFCQEVGCSGDQRVEGALRYKGHLVICMDEWSDFDNMTGTITHRVLGVSPGNFGIAYDTLPANQFAGFGMRLTQHLDAPHLGKMYMDTTFRLGMGIIDEKYIVNASLTLTP